MTAILEGLASPLLPAAVEANLCEENAVFARYLPGATLRDEGDVRWWITGERHPMFNAAWLTRFAPAQAERRIEETLAGFVARSLPAGWSVGPASTPADLAERLMARGLRLVVSQIPMARTLEALPSDGAVPAGFRLEEVRDGEALRAWRRATNEGFEATDEDARRYDTAYLAMGTGAHLPWRHYLGTLKGRPVAAASLLLHAGVAGIYGVTTVPSARRQGIGRAMTLAALRGAREQGHALAILFPSDEALALYRGLGFRELPYRLDHYALPALQ